ncbi:hypothetical protein FB451DRAFT_1204568 [Mycena latifolia]|nr:hypothetical protein FB451DRAFT_1204568 [Mycena latifolia]
MHCIGQARASVVTYYFLFRLLALGQSVFLPTAPKYTAFPATASRKPKKSPINGPCQIPLSVQAGYSSTSKAATSIRPRSSSALGALFTTAAAHDQFLQDVWRRAVVHEGVVVERNCGPSVHLVFDTVLWKLFKLT